ncbi:MAG: hypothetical protein MH321_10330 [Leptospiraceae bacterium]|nr:hypothetical protein [Leptospiraceae bacterium]
MKFKSRNYFLSEKFLPKLKFLFFSVLLFHMIILINCGNSENWNVGKLVPMQEYSEDDPREWENIAKPHLPVARLSMNNGKEALLIENPEFKTSYNHYIENFGAMSLEGKEFDSVSITRTTMPLNYGYIQRDKLPSSERFKIFAKCNQHDLWVRTIKIEDLIE